MIKIITLMYPRKIKEKYAQLLLYCDIQTSIDVYIFRVMLFGIIFAGLLSLLLRIAFDISFFLILILSFLVINITTYAWLSLNADARARFVESMLPDMLQLMSSNLRAGYTVDKALLLSARPEFGRFKDEINRVGKEVATGKEFGEALAELGERVKSTKLKKTIKLVNAGHQAGGELAELLEQSATNLRQQKVIDERIRSSVLIYVIFIFTAIGFGAPVLFGLSSFLIDVMTDLFSKIEIPETSGTGLNLPLTFSKVLIEPSFILQYTITSMIVDSIMGALVLGLIAKGKEKEGLKFIPLFISITIPLFFLVKFLISNLLSGLFNI